MAALRELGTAFLAHPGSEELRSALRAGKLDLDACHNDLLRLLFRSFFRLVARDRGLPLPGEFLRPLAHPCLETVAHENTALLTGQRALTSIMSQAEPMTGVGGTAALPEPLAGPGQLEVEDLGRLYESLLDYRPRIHLDGTEPRFEPTAVGERKRTGSYYTPPGLVAELIEQALVPVMADRLARGKTGPEKEGAILSLRVCDPACGTGHFLLAAGRRLAGELARLRSGGEEPRPKTRRSAVRDVVVNCLYGVDRDPMAVELCRAGLWIEGGGESRPSLLGQHVKCGDSLVGADPSPRPPSPRGKGETWAGPSPRGKGETNREPRSPLPVGERSEVMSVALFDWAREFPEVFRAGGFDVVLGNPPYSARLSEGARELMRVSLPATRSNTNTAVAFLQRARQLLAAGGRFGLVVPHSLTFSGEWKSIRSYLFDDVIALIDAGEAFEGVKLHQILLICGTERRARVLVERCNGPVVEAVPRGHPGPHGGPSLQQCGITMDKEVWRSLGVWVSGLSDLEIGLLQRLRGLPRLRDFVRVYRGLGLQRQLDETGSLPVYGGAQVGVFELLRERGRVAEAAVERAVGRVLIPKVMAQNVVAHVERPRPHAWIKAAVDWSGDAVPLDTVNCVVPTSGDLSLMEIALLLNSRFASWYATRFIFAGAYRTMHFDSPYLGKIPVPDFRSMHEVNGWASRGPHLPGEILKVAPRWVDELVYRLLGLSDEEMAEIDSYFDGVRRWTDFTADSPEPRDISKRSLRFVRSQR